MKKLDYTPSSKIVHAVRAMSMRSREFAEARKNTANSCCICGRKQSKAKGREVAIHIHHGTHRPIWERVVRAIRQEVLQTPGMLWPICKECHENIHKQEELEPVDYVVGFAFDLRMSKVALIRKNRPEWQAGLLNGIGGKIERVKGGGRIAEEPIDAMRREFKEETGFPMFNWNDVGIVYGENWKMHVFYACTPDIGALRSPTDEVVEIHDTENLPSGTVPNLSWLIPLCMCNGIKTFDIVSSYENNDPSARGCK